MVPVRPSRDSSSRSVVSILQHHDETVTPQKAHAAKESSEGSFDPFRGMLHRAVRSCLDNGANSLHHEDASFSWCLFKTSKLLTQIIQQDEPSQEQSLRDYKVTIEYKHLKSHAPGGVYLIPSMETFRTFYGVIFVRRGSYMNGIFKFRLTLPTQYNDVNEHPKIVFTTSVYSPFVTYETGELDIQSTYPRWDPTRHYLVTVLTFVKKIFYAKGFDEHDTMANEEAKRLAQTDPMAFQTKVDECVRASQRAVYDGEPHFGEEKLAHRVLRDLLNDNVKDPNQLSKNNVLAMIDKAKNV